MHQIAAAAHSITERQDIRDCVSQLGALQTLPVGWSCTFAPVLQVVELTFSLTRVRRVTLLAVQQRHSAEALSAVTWLSRLLDLRILKKVLMPP